MKKKVYFSYKRKRITKAWICYWKCYDTKRCKWVYIRFEWWIWNNRLTIIITEFNDSGIDSLGVPFFMTVFKILPDFNNSTKIKEKTKKLKEKTQGSYPIFLETGQKMFRVKRFGDWAVFGRPMAVWHDFLARYLCPVSKKYRVANSRFRKIHLVELPKTGQFLSLF